MGKNSWNAVYKFDYRLLKIYVHLHLNKAFEFMKKKLLSFFMHRIFHCVMVWWSKVMIIIFFFHTKEPHLQHFIFFIFLFLQRILFIHIHVVGSFSDYVTLINIFFFGKLLQKIMKLESYWLNASLSGSY